MGIFTIDEDELKNPKQENILKKVFRKLKRVILTILIVFIGFSLITIYDRYWVGLPMQHSIELNDYTNSSSIYELNNVNLSKGKYLLGFYFGRTSYVKEKSDKGEGVLKDGVYFVEFYEEGKLKLKENLSKWSNNNLNEVFFFNRTNNYHHHADFVYVNVPEQLKGKNITVKLITVKPFSFFEESKKRGDEIWFYIRQRVGFEKKMFDPKKEKKWVEYKKRNHRYTYEPFERCDVDEDRMNLLNALFDKNSKKVISLIEKNNNLNINTIMGNLSKHCKTVKSVQDEGYEVDKILDINQLDRVYNRTPLIYASYFNDIETVKYLISKKANLFHKDRANKNALAYAMEENNLEIVKILVNAGLGIDSVEYLHAIDGDIVNPLVASISRDYVEMSKIILESGSYKDYPSEEINYTRKIDPYFHLKRIKNYRELLELLIKYDIESFGNFKPTEKRIHDLFNECKKKSIAKIECISIPHDLKEEDMNIFIYYDSRNRLNQKKWKKNNREKK